MALFKPYRGNRDGLETLKKRDGYVYFCVNDATLFFDYMDENGELQRKQLNAKDAETLLGATLTNTLNDTDDEIPTSKVVKEAISSVAAGIPSQINQALLEAKESGEFNGVDGTNGINGTDGKDGYSPVRGVDYWTETDKQEIIDAVVAAISLRTMTI